jgi:hypothetical protein
MEGELQAIPNEIPLSSFQKIVPPDYMSEIMKNIISTKYSAL